MCEVRRSFYPVGPAFQPVNDRLESLSHNSLYDAVTNEEYHA